METVSWWVIGLCVLSAPMCYVCLISSFFSRRCEGEGRGERGGMKVEVEVKKKRSGNGIVSVTCNIQICYLYNWQTHTHVFDSLSNCYNSLDTVKLTSCYWFEKLRKRVDGVKVRARARKGVGGWVGVV